MKFQQKPHKKTKDKKSFIEKIRAEEQKKMDRLIETNDKENEDGNLEEKWIQITNAHQRGYFVYRYLGLAGCNIGYMKRF